ncbi:MAG: hypothetical protein JWO38_4711 [Gemmataceae bacterium]|nr:hypothetical protein [Gemmataceae bacterium]
MLPHFGSPGHAISGYLLATAFGGDHCDPIMPDLPVLTARYGVDEPISPTAGPSAADLPSLDVFPT